jgi:ABC-type branched-subunit amino acid transport system substrate-binding protein
VSGSIVVGQGSMSESFKQKFAKYQRKNLTLDQADYAYDGLHLIVEALEESPPSSKPMRERIVEALRAKKNFEGYTGKYTQNKGVFDSPAFLYRLTKDGQEPYTP